MGSHLFSLASKGASQPLASLTNVTPYQWACAVHVPLPFGEGGGIGKEDLGWVVPQAVYLDFVIKIPISMCPWGHDGWGPSKGDDIRGGVAGTLAGKSSG